MAITVWAMWLISKRKRQGVVEAARAAAAADLAAKSSQEGECTREGRLEEILAKRPPVSRCSCSSASFCQPPSTLPAVAMRPRSRPRADLNGGGKLTGLSLRRSDLHAHDARPPNPHGRQDAADASRGATERHPRGVRTSAAARRLISYPANRGQEALNVLAGGPTR